MDKHILLVVLRNVILTSAITHLIILFVFSIRTRELALANAFNILDLDLIWPQLSYGITNFILSYTLILGIGIFWYWKISRKS